MICQAALSLSQWSSKRFKDTYVMRSKVIGQGAFSKVYIGSSISKSEDVAIKVIERAKLCDEEEERLVAEVSVLRELSYHENILALRDAYCEPESYRLVLEYMNGGDLLDIIEEQKCLDEKNARDICLSLMSAITHLHSHLIAHRDIKPENILVSSSGEDVVVKLADFGFAKKEATPNCLSTLCGTPSYVAPELLKKLPYGVKCDIWSAGVIAFVLMGGYQPFQGKTEDEVKINIVNGAYNFDGKYWSHISHAAKDFIEHLLIVNPNDRALAEDMMSHSWFTEDMDLLATSSDSNDEKPVFFMIGSQRSGSNWLRTMLDQREDLVGPHPPHVMREFLPLIAKFGDLSQDENFRILVDHVCTFVERNQVPWNDKYGQRILFCRKTVHDQAKASCERLELQGHDLDSKLYLLSIFDALMDFFAKNNGKELWLCKSMGMSAYHASLLKFYGQRRLRYIYLVRDPRDVAMSFMNTPVGDKHYYAITKKWVKLQEQAIAIVEDTPDILLHIKYEELLENKEDIISCIYDFIGDRRFGGVKRQASVMSIAPVSQSVNQAKRGRESFKAHTLSQQFKNLCRGESFAKEQKAKWRHSETGLKEEDLIIIESLAYDVMEYFGYEAACVKTPADALKFTEAQLEEFARLNEANVEKMMANLKEENIADYNRRIHQAEVLKMDAKLLSDSQNWALKDSFRAKKKKEAIMKKIGEQSIVEEYMEKGILEGFGTFVCGAASQKGYYPSNPMVENQDSFDIRIGIVDDAQSHFFGVYDGHGPEGDRCSQLCKEMIGDIYEEHLSDGGTTKVSLTKAHTESHHIMTKSASINAENSGTTSVIATLKGRILTVAYVGDSAAILGSKSNKRPSMFLTNPHDLSRPDEVARIERKGGLIMSTEEYDKIKEHLSKVSSSSLAKSISNKSLTESVHSSPAPRRDSISLGDHSGRPPSRRDSLSLNEHGSNLSRRPPSRRGSLSRSLNSSPSMSDLMKCVEPSNRNTDYSSFSSLQGTITGSTVKKRSSNQILRDIIQRASTNSLITCDSTNSLITCESSQSYVPRIWCGTSVEKLPGCAFTRSIGDSVAHGIGVSEKPEFKQMAVQDDDVIIIASDGVIEYLDAEAIIDIVRDIGDPSKAASKLVAKSAELWAEKNDYCDDISAIVIFVSSNDGDGNGIDGGSNRGGLWF